MGKGIVRISGTVAGGVVPPSASPVYAVALSEVGPRELDVSNQTTHTTLKAVIQEQVTPSTGTILGTILTLQLSSDNGATWGTLVMYAPDRDNKDGTGTYYQTEIAIPHVLVNTTTVYCKARAWSSTPYIDGGPSTAATSATLAISPIGVPSPTGATIGISSVTPKVDPSNGWQWWEQTITIKTPGGGDPNCWAYQVTVQECDENGTGNPGDSNGAERPWFDVANDGNTVTMTMQGAYVPAGSPYTYTKYKVYGFSRTAEVNTPANYWQDPTYSVLQRWPGGSTSSLQAFGPLPDGAIPGSRIVEKSIGEAQISSVNASSISGTITSQQIDSITADQITGTITAGQIGSVAAATITGSIQAPQIGTVNASAITGGITADKITSVNAGAITGSITAAQIASVNASTISGTVTSQQIDSIEASKITGSIVATTISGTITASQITGAITASQIESVSASAIQGQINADQITTVSASAIQGSITADHISSVAATSITGVIVTSQLADQILDSVSKFSNGIFGTNIVNDGAKITLGKTDTSNMAPNPDFEYDFKDWSVSSGATISTNKRYTGTKAVKVVGANAYVINATPYKCKPGDQFVLQSYVYADTDATGYVNTAVRFLDSTGAKISDGPWGTAYASGAIGVWQSCQTGIAVAPAGATQMQIYAIWTGDAGGTWYLDNVVLTRAVDQSRISSVAAASITGSITASQIGSVAASSLTGLITAAQISSITASQITGAITVSQLAGGITADKISTVSASSILGSISANQIGTVNASAISGTLSWNQIGSVNANSITVNQITAGQIASVNAGSILAGTVTASISLTSPVINGGSITGSSILIEAVSQVTGTCKISIGPSSGGIRIVNSYYANDFGFLSDGLLAVSSHSGEYTNVLPNSINMSGTTIINAGRWTGKGVDCPNDMISGQSVNAGDGGYFLKQSPIVDSYGRFVGQGVYTPWATLVASGVNPYVGGVQYYGASFTFYDLNGNPHTVKGGVLVS